MYRKRVTNRIVRMFFTFVFLLGIAVFSPQAARSQNYDWPQFNFDPQHSGNDTKETKSAPQNIGSLHQLFKISLPSVADGAPAYLSDIKTQSGTISMIFVTTKDGRIIALNAMNGDVIWTHQYGTGTYRINNRFQPTYTTSSPAIDPDREFVYSYGLDGYVHKYRVTDGAETKDGGWPELCTLKPFDEKGSSALAIATVKNGNSYLYVANGGYLGDRGDYQGHLTTINLHDGTHMFSMRTAATRLFISWNVLAHLIGPRFKLRYGQGLELCTMRRRTKSIWQQGMGRLIRRSTTGETLFSRSTRMEPEITVHRLTVIRRGTFSTWTMQTSISAVPLRR